MTTPLNTAFTAILDTILLLVSILSITYILLSTVIFLYTVKKVLNGSAAPLGLAHDAELLDILEHVYDTNDEALSRFASPRDIAWSFGSYFVKFLALTGLISCMILFGRRMVVEFFVQHCLMVPGATVDWKTGEITVPEDFDFEAWKAERLDA